ncbi:hypothetical protein C8Q78DRAFT_990204 [Trametes maxima]|nr:hypothetical protein C8Q78DRAFT_990204 [Trametes maxima]
MSSVACYLLAVCAAFVPATEARVLRIRAEDGTEDSGPDGHLTEPWVVAVAVALVEAIAEATSRGRLRSLPGPATWRETTFATATIPWPLWYIILVKNTDSPFSCPRIREGSMGTPPSPAHRWYPWRVPQPWRIAVRQVAPASFATIASVHRAASRLLPPLRACDDAKH